MAAAFGGKSRYLCMGTVDGAVLIWDLKKLKLDAKISSSCLQVCLDPDAFRIRSRRWVFPFTVFEEAKARDEFSLPPVKTTRMTATATLLEMDAQRNPC
jgi:hypothetical protein